MASRYYNGPVSDHFDGERFYDRRGVAPRNQGDLLRWLVDRYWRGTKAKWPAWARSPYADRPPDRVEGAAWRLSYVGHASWLIQTGGLNILIDPVWSQRASPFRFVGPKRVNDPGIAFADLPPVHAVLVSHAHYDHLDVGTLSHLIAAHRPRVVTPLGNDAIMRYHNPAIAAEAYDWHEPVEIGTGITVTLVPTRPFVPKRSTGMIAWSLAMALRSILFPRVTGRHAACSIETRRYGRASCSKRLREKSTSSAIPATAAAVISAMCASVMASSSPASCRSAPMSRAGSCAIST